MIDYQSQSAEPADRLAKDAKLCKHCGPVVVNAFASQLIVAVKRIDAAKWNLKSSGSGGQAVP
jgi:hypothetical protein